MHLEPASARPLRQRICRLDDLSFPLHSSIASIWRKVRIFGNEVTATCDHSRRADIWLGDSRIIPGDTLL
jgi:hypothetical protein